MVGLRRCLGDAGCEWEQLHTPKVCFSVIIYKKYHFSSYSEKKERKKNYNNIQNVSEQHC